MLETEIKNLTAAIQLLTEAVNKNQPQAPAAAPVPVVEEPKVEAPAAAATANVDSLQKRCLELTTIDKSNSPKIKAIIASYGGKLVKDIPADKLDDLASKLEELA